MIMARRSSMVRRLLAGLWRGTTVSSVARLLQLVPLAGAQQEQEQDLPCRCPLDHQQNERAPRTIIFSYDRRSSEEIPWRNGFREVNRLYASKHCYEYRFYVSTVFDDVLPPTWIKVFLGHAILEEIFTSTSASTASNSSSSGRDQVQAAGGQHHDPAAGACSRGPRLTQTVVSAATGTYITDHPSMVRDGGAGGHEANKSSDHNIFTTSIEEDFQLLFLDTDAVWHAHDVRLESLWSHIAPVLNTTITSTSDYGFVVGPSDAMGRSLLLPHTNSWLARGRFGRQLLQEWRRSYFEEDVLDSWWRRDTLTHATSSFEEEEEIPAKELVAAALHVRDGAARPPEKGRGNTTRSGHPHPIPSSRHLRVAMMESDADDRYVWQCRRSRESNCNYPYHGYDPFSLLQLMAKYPEKFHVLPWSRLNNYFPWTLGLRKMRSTSHNPHGEYNFYDGHYLVLEHDHDDAAADEKRDSNGRVLLENDPYIAYQLGLEPRRTNNSKANEGRPGRPPLEPPCNLVESEDRPLIDGPSAGGLGSVMDHQPLGNRLEEKNENPSLSAEFSRMQQATDEYNSRRTLKRYGIMDRSTESRATRESCDETLLQQPWILCSHFHWKDRSWSPRSSRRLGHRSFVHLAFAAEYMGRYWPSIPFSALPRWLQRGTESGTTRGSSTLKATRINNTSRIPGEVPRPEGGGELQDEEAGGSQLAAFLSMTQERVKKFEAWGVVRALQVLQTRELRDHFWPIDSIAKVMAQMEEHENNKWEWSFEYEQKLLYGDGISREDVEARQNGEARLVEEYLATLEATYLVKANAS